MRKLTVILRTCAKVFALHGTRYIQKTKHEIINQCLSSIVFSINNVNNHDVELFVVDDHSDEVAIKDIKTILKKCKFKTTFVPLENDHGPNASCRKVYEIVENHATDLWYHVEDDYLHFPTAIQDIIDTISVFEKQTNKMIAINPHDDIWRYLYQPYQSFIFLGPYRHYRTVNHTTYTCVASKKIFEKYKNHFNDSAEFLLKKTEDATINNVWRKADVMLVSPIPSLALHISVPSAKDPYIDFDKLWNSIPKYWN